MPFFFHTSMPNKSKIKIQQRSQELESIINEAQPIEVLKAPQAGLAAVLADANAKWNFSKDGANGAMLVRTGVEATGGAAIKVENLKTAGEVNKTSQMMQAFFNKAEGPAPFAAPRVTIYSAQELQNNPQLATKLTGKLQELGRDPNLPDKVRVSNQIESLKQVAAGEGVVLKMEFARGEQLTKLPLEERVALYKTDAFAQSLGRAMPTFMAVGMDDHLGMDMTSFKNNAANLMFDTESGQLSAIDFSTLAKPQGREEDVSLYSYGRGEPNGPLSSVSKADNYLQNALKDPASFEKAVDRLVANEGEGLRGMMEAFTTPVPEGGNFFAIDEVDQLDKLITTEDKRRFASNLILGSAQGLDYLKTNVEALRTATLSMHEEVKGVKLEHIHTEEALGKLCDRIQRVDTDKLNAKVALRTAELKLPGVQAEAQAVQKQSDRLAAKIDRLENNPRIMDRLRFLVRGKESVINKVKDEKAGLDTRGAELTEKETALKEVRKIAEDQLKQMEQAKAAQGVAQPVRLRDNAQIADIAAHHPQQDHAPAVDDLDAGPHKLREDKEMAEVVEHAEELHKPAVEIPDDGKMAAKTPKVHTFSAKS